MSNRRRLVKIKRRFEPGSLPGQIIPPADASPTNVRVIAYSPTERLDESNVSLARVKELREKFSVIWIDVSEFGDVDFITELGELFGLHRLALEDTVNTHQRPKAEEYDDHLFLIARMLQTGRSSDTEQVAFFLGEGYLITFQELPGDCFDNVRRRIVEGKGRIRRAGADYLCYSLIDSIVDGYFPLLEACGERLENLEDAVVRDPDAGHISELHDMKRELLMLRRAVWPHRELINDLIRDEHRLISHETRPFLRDCYDHTIQLMDIIETYREIASGLIDVYISSVSVKLNEVMKVLTIVATIFMPLSFIASLYGMNFDRSVSPWNMPELGWHYGYPFALLLMAASAGGLVWYAWRKGWLLDGPSSRVRKKPPMH